VSSPWLRPICRRYQAVHRLEQQTANAALLPSNLAAHQSVLGSWRRRSQMAGEASTAQEACCRLAAFANITRQACQRSDDGAFEKASVLGNELPGIALYLQYLQANRPSPGSGLMILPGKHWAQAGLQL